MTGNESSFKKIKNCNSRDRGVIFFIEMKTPPIYKIKMSDLDWCLYEMMWD